MALHRQHQFLGGHAASIIGDVDTVDAAAVECHADAARACIERVLHQFFHRRGRPLDHLAGGDAVDDQLGQQPDGGHQGGGGRWRMADA